MKYRTAITKHLTGETGKKVTEEAAALHAQRTRWIDEAIARMKWSQAFTDSAIIVNDQAFMLIFQRELQVATIPSASCNSFAVAGLAYVAVDADHFSALWDRLLDARGEFVGVHISPISESAKQLGHAVHAVPYVTGEPGAFSVWLSEAPIPTATNSNEQAFGGYVFRNARGEFALSIVSDSLFSAEDEDRLLKINARWVDAATT